MSLMRLQRVLTAGLRLVGADAGVYRRETVG